MPLAMMKNNIMYRIIVISIFLLDGLMASAQEQVPKRVYMKSASEFIFSMGNMNAFADSMRMVEMDVSPIVRFSGFFHLQEQLHVDFSKSAGFYTGIGLRNIGMINQLNDSVKVKQRAYSLGIPIAFKFGKLPQGYYVAMGAEAELFFHYRQKDIYDGAKRKYDEWFSNRVNLINPSVFIDIHSNRGTYLRLKYYLMDFLDAEHQQVNLGNGNIQSFYPDHSQLFYIAIGASVRHRTSPPPRPSVEKAKTASR